MKTMTIAVLALSLASAVLGCGSSGENIQRVGLAADTPLPSRRGSVLVDGCVIDPWQRATLASPSTRRVVSEVILLCLVPRLDGTVGPRDESARAHLASVVSDLSRDGYAVHFGVAFTDETGQRYDGAQTRAFLGDDAWRRRFKETLAVAVEPAAGVEIDLQKLPSDARPFVTSLIADAAAVVRPGKKLGVFVPPSVVVPSDLPGGDAFSVVELAKHVDRVRVMTLDYSESAPGPTIDPGWAVDAARLARSSAPSVDISFPLYGTDFGPRGPRPVTFLEARAIAAIAGTPFERGPTGAPFLRYGGFGGESHEVWFDDAESTGIALGAWTFDVLPSDVGVLFYGLGAEDPALFDRLSERTFSR